MSHALAWLGVVSILLKLDKVDSPRAPRSKKIRKNLFREATAKAGWTHQQSVESKLPFQYF